MKSLRRVFVVGSMHSGTSLLLQILSKNKQALGSHGETKFFDSLPMITRKFPDLNDDETLKACIAFTAGVIHSGGTVGYDLSRKGIWIKKTYPEVEQLLSQVWKSATSQRRYGSLFCLVFDEMARIAGRSVWIEKTPTHVHHMDTILQDIPDAYFIEIVRDPRDILASKKKRRHDVWHSERYVPERRSLKHLEKGYDPLWDTLAWKSAVRASAAIHKTHSSQIYSLRYEDLVTSPETEVRSLCNFLGLDYEPSMIDVTYRISADLSRTGHQRGITTDAVGRWQRILDPKELAVCQLVAKEMENLGYQKAPIPISSYLAVPFLLLISFIEFGQRLYRKGRLAGSGYVWNVVLNYSKRLHQILRRL
jgi:omega-hydroxy-beta-dihydromenaquinone-9 sulfotransferase